MSKKGVMINLDESIWISFQKQSLDLKQSASSRIENFMKEEVSQNVQTTNNPD